MHHVLVHDFVLLEQLHHSVVIDCADISHLRPSLHCTLLLIEFHTTL